MNGTSKKTILLVEHEVLTEDEETRIIEQLGYDVITAHSGEKAYEMVLTNKKINLILMDANLNNGLDGPETARKILKERNIPIIFQAANLEKENVERIRKITPYGYIVKNSGSYILNNSIELAFKLFEITKKSGTQCV